MQILSYVYNDECEINVFARSSKSALLLIIHRTTQLSVQVGKYYNTFFLGVKIVVSSAAWTCPCNHVVQD